MLTKRYRKALKWACKLHEEQARKGSAIPYVSHLLAVSSLVIEHGGNEDQAIAALLHDAIEDQQVTDDELEGRFGPTVQSIVRACTDADTTPKPPWRARKVAYIEHLADAPAEALLVSLADKVHNARSIAADVERVGDDYFEVFTGKADGTRWYYRRLLEAFERRADELPAETVDGRSVPGGRSLLRDLRTSVERMGADEANARAYEEQALPTVEGLPSEL